jgi:hypothetical protein
MSGINEYPVPRGRIRRTMPLAGFTASSDLCYYRADDDESHLSMAGPAGATSS